MPEEQGVVILYGSIYGGTEQAAALLAARLAERGVRGIRMYDVSKTHASYLVAECFRVSHIVLASATYNAGIFCNMETFLADLAAHGLRSRRVGLIENGSWAPVAGSLMEKTLAGMKDMTILAPRVRILSRLTDEGRQRIDELAQAIASELLPAERPACADCVDRSALHKLSYGLFALSARSGERDNACIINTAVQLTEKVKRVSITVLRANHTHNIIKETGEFNLSVLTEEAPFSLFQRFGFQSGRDVDKFDGYTAVARSENGLLYLTAGANAFLSCRVIAENELDTHTQFIAEVTEARVLSDAPSATYAYYFDRIKPKPPKADAQKKGWVCKVCGYVYEGETLPADFVCPLCNHGVEDFEPIG